MDEIKIEKGVPLPGRAWRRLQYPFADMEVGDSFSVPVPEGEQPGAFASSLRSNAFRYGESLNMKFTVRLTAANARVRVWRCS